MASIDRRGLSINPSLGIKAPCRVATTGDTLLNGLQTIDGVVLAENDRVLVQNNADASQNGPYNASAGNWTRTLDADSSEEWASGCLVQVTDGTLYGGLLFRAVATDPVDLGVSHITFTAAGRTASVLTYGAKGDGVSDDTAAIQAGEDDISIGALLFPIGTYMVGAAGITKRSNKIWIGDGTGISIVKAKVTPTVDFILANARTNFGFYRLTFDGDEKLTKISGTTYGTLQPLIQATGGSSNFFIKDCEFKKFFTCGVLTNTAYSFQIQDNVVTRTTPNNGTGMSAGNYGIFVAGTGIVDGNEARDFVVRGNRVTNTSIGISGHDGYVQNNTVTGFGFGAGIHTQGLASNFNLVITGNIVGNGNPAQDTAGAYPDGIENWARNSTIANNVVYKCWGPGISNAGQNSVISGNVSYNNGQSGIAGTAGIASFWQDATFNGNGTLIIGNKCFDDQTPKTQQYGYFENANLGSGHGSGINLRGNDFNGNKLGTVSLQAISPRDTNMSNSGFQTFMIAGGTNTADRTFTINPVDGDRTLTMAANVTFSGAFIHQNANTLQFNTSGATTITWPAVTDTAVTLAAAQTLTSKTLTSPTINTPTITTPTITGGTHTAITSLGIRSTGTGAFDLTLANTENLSAGRTLTFTTGDAPRTLTMLGNVTFSGAFIHQNTNTLQFNTSGSTTMTLPSGSHTLAGLDVVQTWTANQTHNSGTLKLAGATSGAITLNAAATAGANTITLPAGTTDFSATGGASQVVKQTSLGGAFTVAQLANTDITGFGTAATVNTGTSGTTIPLCNGSSIVWANSATWGSGAGQVLNTINGGNSGTAGGAGIYFQHAAALNTAIGNKSSILGGAYDAASLLYATVSWELRTANVVALTISNVQAVAFPGVSTTASAANAFLDNAASNNLLRSTSSGRYKTDVLDLGDDEAGILIDRLRPIKYRSLAAADDPRRQHIGLIAEEVAAVDPRFVHFDDQGRPDGVQYDRLTVALLATVKTMEGRVARLEEHA